MRIEHVAMYVNDPEGARDFFIKYFHATTNDGYQNETSGWYENGCLQRRV